MFMSSLTNLKLTVFPIDSVAEDFCWGPVIYAFCDIAQKLNSLRSVSRHRHLHTGRGQNSSPPRYAVQSVGAAAPIKLGP